jgi:acetyl esterase/lipase
MMYIRIKNVDPMTQHIVRPLIWNVAFLLFVLKVIAQESNKGEDFSPYLEEVRSWNKLMQKAQKEGIKTYKSILTPEGLAIQRKNLDNALSDTKTSLKPTVMSMRTGDAQFSLRIFRPKEIRAIILDIHGGAWFMGKSTNDDWLNDQMARQCKAAVVSVDYGLAPEYPFPACIRDC